MSLLNLCRKLQEIGIRYEMEIVRYCPLISVVRNYFANKVAFDLDKEGLFGFTHLLMIDSDSGNFENGVMRLIAEDKPISGLVYATKNICWEKIESAVRQGVHTNHLSEFGTIPDVDAYGPFEVNRLARVRHIGTGCRKKFFVISPKNIRSGNTKSIQPIFSVARTATANLCTTIFRQNRRRHEKLPL
jgi:hypothetical protein